MDSSSMNLLVSLYVVQGYETLATQISIILILPSDFACVSSDFSWRSIPCHTEFSVIDSLSFESLFVLFAGLNAKLH